MSGSLPTSQGFTGSRLKSNQRALISQAQSGRRQVRRFGGHQWEFSLATGHLDVDEWKAFYAFLASQEGQYESFTVVHPTFATPRGTGAGTPQVAGGSQTGGSLNTDGWSPNQMVLKKGDIFKIAGNDKVYMITNDATSNGSGAATLLFTPHLVESPTDNAPLTVTNVAFTVMFADENQVKVLIDNPVYAQVAIDLIEVVS